MNAFQLGAFQNAPAFQTDRNAGGSSGGGEWLTRIPDRRRREEVKERVKALPVKVRQAIKDAARIDDRAQRELALKEQIAGIDARFQALYVQYLEVLYQEYVDQELARLFAIQILE